MRGLIGCVAAAVLVAVGPARGDDPAKPKTALAATAAKDHVGETATVAFTVKHAKDGTHQESYFLDSEPDYKSPDNLAVVITYKDAPAFKAAGIADIVAHFDGKAVRVTGAIVKEGTQTRIRVSDPKQIEVVTPKGR